MTEARKEILTGPIPWSCFCYFYLCAAGTDRSLLSLPPASGKPVTMRLHCFQNLLIFKTVSKQYTVCLPVCCVVVVCVCICVCVFIFISFFLSFPFCFSWFLGNCMWTKVQEGTPVAADTNMWLNAFMARYIREWRPMNVYDALL